MKQLLMGSWILALAVGLGACGQDESLTGPGPIQPLAAGESVDMDIVDTAASAGIFETLVAAVQSAGLEEALRGEGPYTVFAPTDDAFAALPEGTVQKLLLPENQEALQELLLYHVLGKEVSSGDVRWFRFERTLEGQYVWIRKTWWGSFRVNNARIITPDVKASNGIIQVIDTVLLPPGFEIPDNSEPELDIVDTAANAGIFNTLVAAVGAADLVGALRSEGPFTVFAPTDDAFSDLPPGLVDALLLPENKDKLVSLLKYHVVEGKVLSRDLRFYQDVPTLEGSDVRIIRWFGNVWVNRSRVIQPDVEATNGVIHVINRVLIPEGFTLETAAGPVAASSIEAHLESRRTDEAPPEKLDTRYISSN